MPSSSSPEAVGLNLCVYCGSSSGFDSRYAEMAASVGAAIATSGHTLVYGGGHVGLMGVVADAVLAHGGEVIGVMTEQLVELEVAHKGLTRLDVYPNMHERKAAMIDLADGVIVLPGGYGTLDETFEVLTWNTLGIVAVPVVLVNVDDYFSDLVKFIMQATRAGFIKPDHQALVQSADNAADAVRMAGGPAPTYQPKWIT